MLAINTWKSSLFVPGGARLWKTWGHLHLLWEILRKRWDCGTRGPRGSTLACCNSTYPRYTYLVGDFHSSYLRLLLIGSPLDLMSLLKQKESKDQHHFFHNVLGKVAKFCLSLPKLFQRPLPIFDGTKASVTLSQRQVAALMANMFFCTFEEFNFAWYVVCSFLRVTRPPFSIFIDDNK